MFIEKWERLRGIDRWPEVQAIYRTEEFSWLPARWGRPSRFIGCLTFEYRGNDGTLRTKTIRFFALFSFSSDLSSLGPGDAFWVRCSPDNPNRVYVRECARGNLNAALCLPIVIVAVWLRERYRGGR